MINLIPNEEKKKMSKDFYLRLLVVVFIMLGISFLIGFIVILPAYFLSSVEKTSILTKLEFQKNEPIPLPDQDTLLAIKDLKNKLSLIENAKKNKYIFSQKVINEILLEKMSTIKITDISFQNDLQTGKKVNIKGLAPSRDVLLSFRRLLEDNTAFTKVELPISNFVKGSNIKFSLDLIPS